MSYLKSSAALSSALLFALALGACDKPAPVQAPAPVAVPGPAGPTGATGATGATGTAGDTGQTGKPGEGTTVIVVEPPASAAQH